ncbi:hypothetical protein LCGC14_0820360, partial [marine sediment metagenome]
PRRKRLRRRADSAGGLEGDFKRPVEQDQPSSASGRSRFCGPTTASQPEPPSTDPGHATPESSPAAATKSSLSLASVRFAQSTLKSVVKDINLTEVRVIAKRDQAFPGILEQAVVDIDTGEGQMARLNGYVHQLQAVDKRQDTDFVSVTIRFVDEDPQKLEDLSRFVARFRAGKR